MDAYADAAGLVERSAAAYAGGVPEQPADDGYFGPGSVTWRWTGDLSWPVGGLRALLLQALHPLAMAGVDQHSDWREDPVGRLAATSRYLAIVSFGEKAAAERVAARVRRVHERITGTDHVTGLAYAASDPALLLWVHCALVDSNLTARELFGTQPQDGEADAYVREQAIAAELVGVPREQVPESAAELAAYIESVRPELRCTPAAAGSGRTSGTARSARCLTGPPRSTGTSSPRSRRPAAPRSGRHSACSTPSTWASQAYSKPASA